MQDLLILTSTYGEGDPPSNASRFPELLETVPIEKSVNFAVVGFGSLAYPNFCQFALDVHEQMSGKGQFTAADQPFLIHNKSYTSFKSWAKDWGYQLDLHLELPPEPIAKERKLHRFRVLEKQTVHDGFSTTFTLQLQSDFTKFQSGDLLAVVPPDDPVERLYSIAKIRNNAILLSIKLHERGICSKYLHGLNIDSTFEASIQENEHFHFPANGKPVHLIANGTGIAPYFGMLHHRNTGTPVNLYWGGRTFDSYELYRNWIEEARLSGRLNNCQIALSREKTPFRYVQDIVQKEEQQILSDLSAGGTIMICGSIAMMNDVLKMLEKACLGHQGIKLDRYHQRSQILMDCY